MKLERTLAVIWFNFPADAGDSATGFLTDVHPNFADTSGELTTF